VGDRGVVEGTVRLDVGDAGPRRAGDAVERGELVEDVVGQVGGVDVDEPAAEPGQVPVADLRADRHAPLGGPGHRRADHHRVPGVEAAGHVGAGDHAQQCFVVAEFPAAETFGQVRVEIHRRPHFHSAAMPPTELTPR
jgi:hypothetical protein